jgi:hypothetical protein
MVKNNFILTFAASVVLLFCSVAASAQEFEAPAGYEYVDSLVYVRLADVDSSYVGVNVFGTGVNQSDAVFASMRNHLASNPSRTISGYRVRIFFDNKQSARVESEKALKKFESMFHDVFAYRTYTNPYFKVTVGDCRTKSEAMALLGRIKKVFPSAFVVKENIALPPVDKTHVYEVDTVKVLRPVMPQ